MGEGSYEKPEEGEQIDKDTLSAGAAPDVVLKGNVNIDGINVTLAGIYLSLGNKLRISGGSEVNVFGTTGKDGVDAVLTDEGNTLTVDTGSGNDAVTVTTEGEYEGLNTVKVETAEGDDTVTVTHNTGVLSAEVSTGAGKDKFTASSTAEAKRSWTDSASTSHESSFSVNMGEGDDTATVNASLGNAFSDLSVEAGAGSDMLELVGDLNKDKSNAISGDITKNADGYQGNVKMIASGIENEVMNKGVLLYG